jgi:hypothetical protein
MKPSLKANDWISGPQYQSDTERARETCQTYQVCYTTHTDNFIHHKVIESSWCSDNNLNTSLDWCHLFPTATPTIYTATETENINPLSVMKIWKKYYRYTKFIEYKYNIYIYKIQKNWMPWSECRILANVRSTWITKTDHRLNFTSAEKI